MDTCIFFQQAYTKLKGHGCVDKSCKIFAPRYLKAYTASGSGSLLLLRFLFSGGSNVFHSGEDQ
ncbi:hypothetical protein O5D80_007621 [Batrachochytrium dendrobatidis]|nr:hypothetical protein O5D80_007621 [Batrachochytrium dendrobatidis]